MADDLAFLFNDPSHSPSRRFSGTAVSPSRPRPHEARQLPADIDWMTLRQAHNETSIPISTLRKWAKKGKVRARLVRTEGKELRLVAMGDVVGRARALERTIQPVPAEAIVDLRDPAEVVLESVPAPTAESAPTNYIAPVSKVESASRASAPIVEEAAPEDAPTAPEEAPAAPQEAPTAPEGSIMVPLDAWDRMLGQLGNLHEAGQQLAEARERAAKAETEAQFLKERLREMRRKVENTELALELQSADSRLPQAPPAVEPVLHIGWRRFRDRWLSGK